MAVYNVNRRLALMYGPHASLSIQSDEAVGTEIQFQIPAPLTYNSTHEGRDFLHMIERIRTLIVDDERYSREELIYLLKQRSTLEIVGEADSGEQAVLKTMQLKPEAVFLDIEMPLMNGLETARALNELKLLQNRVCHGVPSIRCRGLPVRSAGLFVKAHRRRKTGGDGKAP